MTNFQEIWFICNNIVTGRYVTIQKYLGKGDDWDIDEIYIYAS